MTSFNEITKKRFVIDDDKVFKFEQTSQSDIGNAKHVVGSSLQGNMEETIFGFTTLGKLEAWLTKQDPSEQDAYQQLQRLTRRALEMRASHDEKRLRALQQATIERAAQRLEERLQANGVKSHESDRIHDLLVNYDPLEGPHSAVLYQHENFGGRWLYLPCGGAYPDLGWFDFDNRTSSFFDGCQALVFYQFTWFEGLVYWDLVPGLTRRMGWFNDRTSSAVTGLPVILL